MEHIAIDLGGRESQICVRSESGEIVEEKRLFTSTLAKYLAKRESGRVIVETCAEAFTVAESALECGHEVRVVPGTLVRTLGVGARKTKTDKKDARVLSEVSARIDLPSVHIPSKSSRDLKTICGMREILVGTRTKLINSVRGWLRTHARRPASGATSSFSSRVRTHCQKHKLTMLACVDRQLDVIDTLNEQIKDADKDLRTCVEGIETCRLLMTVPGVGPVTSARFVSAIDDVSRFHSGSAVASYFGLVPGEKSSSDKKRRLSITKAGAAKVRWTLVQAAWVLWRTQKNNPLVAWAEQIELRRGRRIAITALARKLTVVMFAMWRDSSRYNALLRSGIKAVH